MFEQILDALNTLAEIAFITYAWLTMIRLNAFLNHKDERGKKTNDIL